MSLKESFDRDGFVVIDGVFNSADLLLFQLAYDKIRIYKPDIGERYDTLAQTPAFLRLVCSAEVVLFATHLLGTESPLYCFTNRCRIDPPRDDRRTYGWHQEVYYTIPESRFIQTWAPLISDTTVANGTIEVCVGSHKGGIAPQDWRDVPGRATQVIVPDDVASLYEQRAIPMRLGQCLFFSPYLFHRSGNNTSQEIRHSLVGMYHDVSEPKFKAPRINFDYRGMSPREYYESRKR